MVEFFLEASFITPWYWALSWLGGLAWKNASVPYMKIWYIFILKVQCLYWSTFNLILLLGVENRNMDMGTWKVLCRVADKIIYALLLFLPLSNHDAWIIQNGKVLYRIWYFTYFFTCKVCVLAVSMVWSCSIHTVSGHHIYKRGGFRQIDNWLKHFPHLQHELKNSFSWPWYS